MTCDSRKPIRKMAPAIQAGDQAVEADELEAQRVDAGLRRTSTATTGSTLNSR